MKNLENYVVSFFTQVFEWLWNCDEYKLNRRYPKRAMSTEEADFPIAYIIVAHKDAAQVRRWNTAV